MYLLGKHLTQDVEALKVGHVGYVETIVVQHKFGDSVALVVRKFENLHRLKVHSHQCVHTFGICCIQKVGM